MRPRVREREVLSRYGMTRSLFSTRMAPGARMAFPKGSGVRNVELNLGARLKLRSRKMPYQ